MKLGYRIIRSTIYVILGILALTLQGNITGLSIYFGMAAVTASGLSLIYLFMHFDENMAKENIIEMLMDGFSGLIIFTYPQSDNQFFIIVFSFWIAIMGVLMLVSGLFNKHNKDFLWFYTLLGISFIVVGFSIMHVTIETQSMIGYLIGFTLIIYGGAQFWLLNKRKQEIY